MTNTLRIVGAGPGTPELLTAEAHEVINSCSCFAGGSHLLGLAPAGSVTFAIGADLEAARAFIKENLAQGDVCVLTSGDPGCFSILADLAAHFLKNIRVAPGISSVQLMAARLCMPWQDWELVSLHGRGPAGHPQPPTRATLYFCDAGNTPQAVARLLLEQMNDCPAAAASDLGRDSELILASSLGEIAAGSFSGNSLLLVLPGQVAEHPIVSAPGIPDGLWLRREGVPLSKSEVRSVLLSLAQPASRRIIWDVGAGTGSYGIECSLLAPRAKVFSIDKNPDACKLVQKNAARFGATVEAVCGPAPDVFAGLPEPDLIVIGGNDGRLPEIFNAALAALAPAGRIVVTALLEETRKAAHAVFADSGLLNRQAVKVAIARGEAQKWVEHNPVIIFSGDKLLINKES